MGITRAAVIGHVEWVHLLSMERRPETGQIQEASGWTEFAAGGGCAAAVQLAKLADECHLFTAVGEDEEGRLSLRQMEDRGLRVHAVQRRGATRRAVVEVDGQGERTIIVHGPRHEPRGEDALPWHLLDQMDCVLFTAGDALALRAARTARRLIVVARGIPERLEIPLDAVVGSGSDVDEVLDPRILDRVALTVVTRGHRGGTYRTSDAPIRAFKAPELRDRLVDSYGAGDAFAAGLTFGLGRDMPAGEAVRLAALCGTRVLAGRGPYESQITASELRS